MPKIALAVIPTPPLSNEEKALLLAVSMAGELEFSAVLKKDRAIVDTLARLEQRGLVVIKPRHQESRSDLSDFEQLAYLSPLGRSVVGFLEKMLTLTLTTPSREQTPLAQKLWQ